MQLLPAAIAFQLAISCATDCYVNVELVQHQIRHVGSNLVTPHSEILSSAHQNDYLKYNLTNL